MLRAWPTWKTRRVNPSRPALQDHLPSATNTELFALYRATLAELRSRRVIRTDNAPTGDYAEHLVVTAFGGALAPNSEKSWDIRTPDNQRLQVKARVVSSPAKRSQLQLSPFRSFDFDAAIIVLLSGDDFAVRRAVRLPAKVVEEAARYVKHVNGWILHATDEVLKHPLALDITSALRASAALDAQHRNEQTHAQGQVSSDLIKSCQSRQRVIGASGSAS